SDVPFFSSLHGRERRALRGIDRLDLQAAVKYGRKQRGRPNRATGERRWMYTHADIVYITDASSTREITSYAVPIDIPHPPLTRELRRGHEEAKRRLERDLSLCTSHTVIVVDQSGSMKTSDVFDFKNRSQAVFGMLALDFVAKQRLSQEGTDTDVVSLVLMRDSAEVVFEREPMGLVLYDMFVGLHDDGEPRSHGNYLPALAAAEELLGGTGTANGCCALALLFLSDGRPSDQIVGCDGEIYQSAVDIITDRVRSLAGLFGQQLCVTTLGVARRDGDFSVLEAMADAARDAGAHGEFHRPELSSEGLSTAIASSVLSLTATRRRLTTLANEGGRPRQLRQVEKEAAGCSWGHAPTADLTGGDWVVYTDRVQRFEYSSQAKQETGYPWVAVSPFSEEANGIAIRKKASGTGAERLVFGLRVC
ncbi:unnamed protein product, partial [Laminaria digitata]